MALDPPPARERGFGGRLGRGREPGWREVGSLDRDAAPCCVAAIPWGYGLLGTLTEPKDQEMEARLRRWTRRKYRLSPKVDIAGDRFGVDLLRRVFAHLVP